MANTVISLKKSAVPSAEPSNLANGELALNFADGKLFYKHANGSIIAFNTSGGNSYGTVNANGTLIVAGISSDVITLLNGNNITIVGDAINDRITIGLTNDVVVQGALYVKTVGGDEGGQIELGNAATNSILSGNVAIDIYQNRIRFFETGGTNRGAYINIASATAGVGTDLLAGATDGTARTIASAAYDKANSANVLAYNTGIGANAFASATIAGANTDVGAGANSYAASVGTGSNNYLLSVIAGANSAVGSGANSFASATIAGANTAVGTGANNYMLATIAGANTNVGVGANNWSNTKLANATGTFAGTLTITGNTVATNVIIYGGIVTAANGNYGAAGQVLTTNGSATYWSTPSAGGGGGSTSKFSANVGDGTSTTINVTHSLNKTDLWFTVREISSGYIVYPDIVYSNSNACQLIFVTAPTANQYYISILGS